MSRLTVYIFAVLPMLFWAFTFIWYKIVLDIIDPVSVIFFRLVTASILLILYTGFIYRPSDRLAKNDYLKILILAFFEPFIYFLGESYGMQYVSPTIASVIISLIPVVTPVFAFRILDEKLNAFNIAGLLLSFCGVVLILVNPASGADFTYKGIALLFLAVTGAVGYGITVKKLSADYSSMTITKYQSIFGTFLFLPLFLILDMRGLGGKISASLEAGTFGTLVMTLFAMSLFASVLAFVLIIKPIRELGISKTNVFTNLIPVFTAVLSFMILNEQFDLRKAAGIALVISGIALSQIKGIFRKKTFQIM